MIIVNNKKVRYPDGVRNEPELSSDFTPRAPYRVYWGDKLVYPERSDLETPYRLHISCSWSYEPIASGYYYGDPGGDTEEVLIETAYPCYVRKVRRSDAYTRTVGGCEYWDGTPGRDGVTQANISDALIVGLPAIYRGAWVYPGYRDRNVWASEADTMFITKYKQTRATDDEGRIWTAPATTYLYAPCGWQMRGGYAGDYNLAYPPHDLTDSERYFGFDDRLMEKYSANAWHWFDDGVGNGYGIQTTDPNGLTGLYGIPMRRLELGYSQDTILTFACDYTCGNLYYGGFYRYFNGTIKKYPPTSGFSLREDITSSYLVLENNNPTYSSFEAWLEEIRASYYGDERPTPPTHR